MWYIFDIFFIYTIHFNAPLVEKKQYSTTLGTRFRGTAIYKSGYNLVIWAWQYSSAASQHR